MEKDCQGDPISPQDAIKRRDSENRRELSEGEFSSMRSLTLTVRGVQRAGAARLRSAPLDRLVSHAPAVARVEVDHVRRQAPKDRQFCRPER